jgi:hypothetical protein
VTFKQRCELAIVGNMNNAWLTGHVTFAFLHCMEDVCVSGRTTGTTTFGPDPMAGCPGGICDGFPM